MRVESRYLVIFLWPRREQRKATDFLFEELDDSSSVTRFRLFRARLE